MNPSSPSVITGSKIKNSFKRTNKQLLCLVLWLFRHIFQGWVFFFSSKFVSKYKALFNESVQSILNNWLQNQQQLGAYNKAANVSGPLALAPRNKTLIN